MTEDSELFRLDLAQMEVLRRLSARLVHGLRLYDQYTEAVAVQESLADALKAGIEQPEGQTHDPEATIARLRADQTRMLVTIKAATWRASDSLRALHAKARDLLKSPKEE